MKTAATTKYKCQKNCQDKKHITYKKYLFFINKLVVFLEFLLAKDNYIYGLDSCLRRNDKTRRNDTYEGKIEN